VAVEGDLYGELAHDEARGERERQDDTTAAGRRAYELADEKHDPDQSEHQHDAAEVAIEADQVEPGNMGVRERARSAPPFVLVER
jgi:hypothetical protein